MFYFISSSQLHDVGVFISITIIIIIIIIVIIIIITSRQDIEV